ncbi:hypothetical protein [Rhizobium sp. CRRU65]|uniref:hypothetical protein n=1 Tax=Rhizobium sp. CRRU65 TaxID=3399566 RepID=UPI003AF98B20
MLRTLLLPELSPILETPHGIYATDEEVAAANRMITQLEASLLAAPEETFDIYWIHCGHDSITWGGIESGVTEYKGPPPPNAWIDFDDVGCGKMWDATPRELHRLMFSVPHSQAIRTHLLFALLWESDRVKNGERERVHDPCISNNLIDVVDGIEESCRMIETREE